MAEDAGADAAEEDGLHGAAPRHREGGRAPVSGLRVSGDDASGSTDSRGYGR